jgi:hypothetical protein
MALTDKGLLLERPYPASKGAGVQRLYQLPGGYGLSLVDSPGLYSFAYAWDAVVIRGDNLADGFEVAFDTPLMQLQYGGTTGLVFHSDDEANAFIECAWRWAESLVRPAPPSEDKRTVWDTFAAAALSGLCAGSGVTQVDGLPFAGGGGADLPGALARGAADVADALMALRKERPAGGGQ